MKTPLYLLLALGLSAGVQAQVPARQDYCHTDALSRRVADATALIVPKVHLIYDKPSKTYTLSTSPFNYYIGDIGNKPICPGQPYYNQVRSLQGRTGFLVGNQALVTAPHGPTSVYNPADYAVIFNWRWIADGAQPTESPDLDCKLQNEPNAIPEGDVYYLSTSPTPPVPLFNTKDLDPTGNADYVVFSLNRPVPGVRPLPLRRSGEPLLGDALIVPGHPDTVPIKIGFGGRVQRTGALGISIGEPPLSTGSSGSPVFNTRAQLVESVVARSSGGAYWMLDVANSCHIYQDRLTYVDFHSNDINNGPLKVLADHVPQPADELVITPQHLVQHAVSGSGISNQASSFAVSLPAGAPAAVDYMVKATSINAEAGHPGVVWSISPDATALQTASPGSTQRYTVHVNQPTPHSCESFDGEVRITPKTAGMYATVIPHRFEVQRGDFSVSPDADWNFTHFAAPYPTRQLTISNPGPMPMLLEVIPSDSWLLVDGIAATTVSLTAAGTPGDTATVELSIAASPDLDVPPGTTGHARVVIAPVDRSICLNRSLDEEIDVFFTNGVREYTVADTTGNYLPGPAGGQTFGAPRDFDLDLSALSGHTVADLDLELKFWSTPPVDYPAAQADTRLKIDLGVSTHGTTYTLWDRNDATAPYFVNHAFASWMKLDDATTPPLGPSLLSAVNALNMGGIWKVRLYATEGGKIGPEQITLRFPRN